MLDTYLQSTFLYSAILVPSLQKLQLTNEKVEKALLKSIPKSRKKSIEGEKLKRLSTLFQVTPMERKFEKEAASFVNTMAGIDTQDPDTNARKVRKNAQRTLWLLRNGPGNSTLAMVLNSNMDVGKVRERIVED